MDQSGLSVDDIIERLANEFDEVVVPDRSTVFRQLKRLRAQTNASEVGEDVPFSWSKMAEVPWEASGILLDVSAFYEALEMEENYGPFTRRLAKWVWRVIQGLNRGYDARLGVLFRNAYIWDIVERRMKRTFHGWSDPDEDDILTIASEYSWRELGAEVFSEPFDTRDLDLWFAFAPWRSRERIEQYNEIRNKSHGGRWVRWRYYDPAWLKRIMPDLVDEWGATRDDSADDILKRLDEGPRRLFKMWIQVRDGLLPSQLFDYDHNLEQGRPADHWGGENIPWHLTYLKEMDDTVLSPYLHELIENGEADWIDREFPSTSNGGGQ